MATTCTPLRVHICGSRRQSKTFCPLLPSKLPGLSRVHAQYQSRMQRVGTQELNNYSGSLQLTSPHLTKFGDPDPGQILVMRVTVMRAGCDFTQAVTASSKTAQRSQRPKRTQEDESRGRRACECARGISNKQLIILLVCACTHTYTCTSCTFVLGGNNCS